MAETPAAPHTLFRETIIAGLAGAAAVALWFLLLDAVQGRILFTPGALGSALFLGAQSAEQVSTSPGIILGYTVLHVAAFLALGFIVAYLARQAELFPPLVIGAGVLFVTMEVFFIGLVALAARWLLDLIPWWSFAVANLIAAAVMGAFLWREHPGIGRELADDGIEERLSSARN
jgi:hypothetical protein